MILIKQHSSIQLAHLYEHIICARIEDLFYLHGLCPLLDYSLIGRTFHQGIVCLDLEFYTDRAEKHANEIRTLKVDFNYDSIDIAIEQIIAEHQCQFGSLGYEAIKDELEILHQEPWQDTDDIDSIDTNDIQKQAGSLYLAEYKPTPAVQLTVNTYISTGFATQHRNLMPLFRQFARLFACTTQITICDEFGYYSKELKFTANRKRTQLANIFSATGDIEIDIDKVLATCQDTIIHLQHHTSFQRLIVKLRKASHDKATHLLPHPQGTLEDTDILIGTKGWGTLATDENCALLLKNMSVEVRHGRKHVHAPLITK
jgi:hypothetical protein